MPAGPGGVDEQRDESLDPAVDRHVIDVDATLGEELCHVAIGQPVARVPATAIVITPGGKRNPAKPDLGSDGGTRRRRISQPARHVIHHRNRASSAG
jgi:hypothetical protein